MSVGDKTGPERDFGRIGAQLTAIQGALVELEIDGWLLYDLRGRNPVAGELLGLGALTRRYFVWIPAEGEPTAASHGRERGPCTGGPWWPEGAAGWGGPDRAVAAGRGRTA